MRGTHGHGISAAGRKWIRNLSRKLEAGGGRFFRKSSRFVLPASCSVNIAMLFDVLSELLKDYVRPYNMV